MTPGYRDALILFQVFEERRRAIASEPLKTRDNSYKRSITDHFQLVLRMFDYNTRVYPRTLRYKLGHNRGRSGRKFNRRLFSFRFRVSDRNRYPDHRAI